MNLDLEIDKESQEPMFLQIANKVKAVIDKEDVKVGDQLPSSRILSESLGVSRFTAVRAYEELQRAGYVKTCHYKGTYVTKLNFDKKVVVNETYTKENIKQLPLSNYGRRIMLSPYIEGPNLELHSELNYSAPAPERLPINSWHKMIIQSCRSTESELEYVGDLFGHRGLREELARYLQRARGLDCSADQICLFSSAQSALDMLSRVLLNEGDPTACENPGFPGARRTFASLGAEVSMVGMDRDGMNVSDLMLLEPRPKLIYITPTHHDPTGVTLSGERRKELLAWAGHNKVIIIEDDFDGDYRYGDISTPPLKAHDQHDQVIYLSSFWKVMFPVLHIGFVVLPSYLIPVIQQARSLVEKNFFFIEHEALARFIRTGGLEKHIRKTRKIYAKRRIELVKRLNTNLGTLVQISPASAGTHLLIRFSEKVNPEDIVEAASHVHLPLLSTNYFYPDHEDVDEEFLIPFAHVDEEHIINAVEAFAVQIAQKANQ